jgi:hypothetical protein
MTPLDKSKAHGFAADGASTFEGLDCVAFEEQQGRRPFSMQCPPSRKALIGSRIDCLIH